VMLMPPEKHILDVHVNYWPYLMGIAGLASTVRLQTVLAWIAIIVPVVSAVIGGLILLGINNTQTQITEVKTSISDVANKQENIRKEVASEVKSMANKIEQNHKEQEWRNNYQDVCISEVRTKMGLPSLPIQPRIGGGELKKE